MTLYIKNMVCRRCIKTVNQLIESAGLHVKAVRLGEVDVEGTVDAQLRKDINQMLQEEGFELLDDKNSKIVEQIKTLVIGEIHYQKGMKKESMNYSDFLAKQTGYEYSFLSKLFSGIEGITIEKYIIAQKIERAKELLIYDELTLSEIALRMEYSSSHHLSNQFKQHTGMTPTAFKKGHSRERMHIDHIAP